MFGNLRIGYWLLIAIIAIEFVIGATFGRKPMDQILNLDLETFNRLLPGWILLPLLWFGYLAVEITRRRVNRPFSAIKRLVYRHRFWLLRGMLFVSLIFPLVRAFSSFKSAIPDIVPFYADPLFASLDKSLFGIDPWRLTHAVIGPSGTVVIDRLYTMWFILLPLLVGWLSFTRNQKLQLQGLLTYAVTWALLGNFLATMLSSVGPCFYKDFYNDDRYAILMSSLTQVHESSVLISLNAMAYLLDTSQRGAIGTGISAMPSLHVAIAFVWFFVVSKGTAWLWPKLLAGAYAAVILVGSVHLGWHYAVDGIVSIIGVTLIWFGAGRFVDWVDARGFRRSFAENPVSLSSGTEPSR